MEASSTQDKRQQGRRTFAPLTRLRLSRASTSIKVTFLYTR